MCFTCAQQIVDLYMDMMFCFLRNLTKLIDLLCASEQYIYILRTYIKRFYCNLDLHFEFFWNT